MPWNAFLSDKQWIETSVVILVSICFISRLVMNLIYIIVEP